MALTVPLERITSEARRIDFRKGLLALVRLVGTLVLAIPYGIAWGLRVVVLGLTMLWVAAVAGWRDAGRPRREDGSET
ncbi:hypothetical protein [Nonomuraea angiospora]|uniref:hypothetical protein n=1 Tax=Nonomuraea angiospora TaxID=46172 RepID=UPI0029A6142F|nr:hypothetical protein [Nonomuraea angiospora]MDX3101741.1 hypothetical protein [Nonomuraea angiospora]